MDRQKVSFKIFRFNKERDYLPYYQTIEMEVSTDEVVLDVLNRIKWDHDGSFTYRRSCRHGICGSCAIKINGKPQLACKDNVFELVNIFGATLTIEPQDINRAYKDLVIDKSDFWQKYERVEPYLIADIEKDPKEENVVSKDEVAKLDDSDYCIECGSCYYSCPVVEVNDKFIGPAALTKAWRFVADSRDNKKDHRLKSANLEESGIWDCVKCNECVDACPKDIRPYEKITKLHQESFKESVVPNSVASRHAVGFKHSIKRHGILDEGELVRYSEGNIGVLKHIPTALKMLKKGKLTPPWKMPKSKNLDEIRELIKSSSTLKDI
jgi:succinate dehydrogenase / fumarate reductase iron-sulfur subunit